MSTPLRIIAVNEADSATVTVSPAVVDNTKMTKDGIKDERRSRILRTTSASDQTITLTWAADVLISGILLGLHNLTTTGTARIQLYSDSGSTSEVYDSRVDGVDFPLLAKVTLGALEFGFTPLGARISDQALNNTPHWLPTPKTARVMKITLSDSTNPDGYMQLGRVMCGRHIQPLINFNLGYTYTAQDRAIQVRTEGGSLHSEEGNKVKRLQIQLSWLAPGDRERFVRHMRTAGKVNQLYVSLFPEQANALELDHEMICKLVSDPTYTGSRQAHTDVTYTFEEA